MQTIKANNGDIIELVGENCGVYFNKDCLKYGIKRHCKCHAYGDHWPQVATPNGGICTPYKAVAIRWARDYIAKYGDKLMNIRGII